MQKIRPDDGEMILEILRTLKIKPQILQKWSLGMKVRVPTFDFMFQREPPPPPPDPVVEKAAELIRDKEQRRGSGVRASRV